MFIHCQTKAFSFSKLETLTFCFWFYGYKVTYSPPFHSPNPKLFGGCVFSVTFFSNPTALAHCINDGKILIFKVSKQLYWFTWHDRIFGSSASACLVATSVTKRKPFDELKSWSTESKLITPEQITGTSFGAMVANIYFSHTKRPFFYKWQHIF